MRKLLNTLYVTSENAYLALDGDTVVVKRPDEKNVRIPLLNLEGIVTFSYAGASPALLGKVADEGIGLSFLTPSGKFLARVHGANTGNVLLRKEQYRRSDDELQSMEIAKNMLSAKLYNSRWCIERVVRDHPLRIDVDKFKKASNSIQKTQMYIESATKLEQLFGLEGEAAIRYFSVFDDSILQQKEAFYFHGRNKRPPLDNINALLSFVYTLLAHDCASALESVGLDAYVGFLHQDRPGRFSLALDLMEEFRSVLADNFVLMLVNKRMVNAKGFEQAKNGSVHMKKETRKIILEQWQKRKNDTLTHPYLKENISWGLVPYAQALLLARFLRRDLDGYPAFLWK